MVTAAFFLLISNRVEARVPELEPVAYRVEPGDSLWGLASNLELDRDVRAVVAEIADINGLGSSVIRPGQVLMLPAS
jgi:hypothetical protein